MTTQVTWDDDPPKTGMPDEGTDTKLYDPVPAAGKNFEITKEPVGSGPVIDSPFSVPLITIPSSTSVNAGDDFTVDGSGLQENTTGTLALVAGPAGTTGGDVLVSVPVTADALGAIPETTLSVPADAPEGEYHLVLSGGAVMINSTGVTVGGVTPTEPAIMASPTTIDSSGDEASRTVTVDGENFPASLAGRISIMTGAPGSGGTEVVGADVTTDATGVLPSTPLIVPAGQAAGDYHVHAEYAGVTVDDVALTVTTTPVVPEITATPDTVDSAGDETARTITVDGVGFAAATAGTLELLPGAPGSGGTAIESIPVTTDAAGEFTGEQVIVPAGQAAGDYHLVATFGADVVDDTPITVTNTPAPIEPPENVTVGNIGPASVEVSWDEVVGATGYAVWYKPTAEAAWMYAGEVTTPTLSATVTSLTAETEYDFAVTTIVDSEMSDRSATVTESTIAGGAPLAQASVTAGTPTATSVPLTWDPVADAQSYQIRWREAADTDWASTYGDEDGASTGTSMEGLTAATEYVFGVRAIGDGTTNTSGPWSADVLATTAAAALRKRAAKKTTKK